MIFFRRKQYLILPNFQFRYIGLLIGITSFVCLAFVLAAKHYINLNLDPLIESGLISSPALTELIKLEKNFLWENLLSVFLVLISIVTLAGIFITHRIAGPIFALQRRMKEILNGEMKDKSLRIREGDEFQYLIDTFNEMTSSLRRQILDQQELIEKVKTSLSEAIEELEKRSYKKEELAPLYELQRNIKERVSNQREIKKEQMIQKKAA